MRYKGTFTDIWEALKAFPKGAGDDDFVIISGKAHRWSKHMGMFVTDGVHVPEMPDKHPVITLFTELTDGGVLTDHMGNKWQLAPYVERIAVPVITVTDITQDVYPYTTYPRMQNKRLAVMDIVIEEGEADCELEYKVIKGRGSEEPYAWTAYDDHFTLNQPGDYQIVARAKKEGKYSELVYCSEFTIEACVYDTEYTDLRIETFRYPQAPAVVESGDITVAPVIGYSQGLIEKYTDGRRQEASGRTTTGATLEYSISNAIAGVSFDSETAIVTAPPNTTRGVITLGYVTVTASLNGKTASVTNNVTQAARSKRTPSLNWNPDPRYGTHYVGDSVEFGLTAGSGGAVTFKDGSDNTITSSITLSSTSTVLKYFVEETDDYLPLEGQITINAIQRVVSCIYAFATLDATAPAPTTVADLTTNIDSRYTRSGNFSGDGQEVEIDCSTRDTSFCMSWFAIPKDKTLQIRTKEDASDITSYYPNPTTIGDYKVYIQTVEVGYFIQDIIILTFSNN